MPSYLAPAKLNLFLHVTGRRSDGYHTLQTVFRLIDAADTVHLTPTDDPAVVLETPLAGVPPEHDLTVRAARLLQTATGCPRGCRIRLDKRLPMGGGLGGGSSDAATVLIALNHLWGLGLSRAALQALGLRLGADVPVFIFGRDAFAEGVGEALVPIDLPPAAYLVLVPPVSVPTAEIFNDPGLTRDTKPIKMAAFPTAPVRNDLQPVATKKYPVIQSHLDWLDGNRVGSQKKAMMTGSGACVFAAFDTLAEAEALGRRLPPGMRGFAAQSLKQHPLSSLLVG
jgi:4-diphosphocytidyl-2-C-methyl-D-erythritol kinase